MASTLKALWGGSSWFGGPHDSTTGSTTASGAPTSTPGIAVYDKSTLGGWWLIKAPNGDIGMVQQTDIGPAPSTGRKFDYTYSLLSLFGYSEKDFPTGKQTFGYYLGHDLNSASVNLSNALADLGATPQQAVGFTGATDSGSVMRGFATVIAPTGHRFNTFDPKGSSTSSEAVPSNIIPTPDISTPSWLSVFGFLGNMSFWKGLGLLIAGLAVLIFAAIEFKNMAGV